MAKAGTALMKNPRPIPIAYIGPFTTACNVTPASEDPVLLTPTPLAGIAPTPQKILFFKQKTKNHLSESLTNWPTLLL